MVWIQLPLECNSYLLFNSDIVNFVWKTDEGDAGGNVLLILVLWWWCFYCMRWWARDGGMGQKVLFTAR